MRPKHPQVCPCTELGSLALPEPKLPHSTPRPLLASCGLALGYSGCGQSPGWPRCSSHGAQLPPACTAKCPPAPNHCPPPSGWEGSVAAHPATTTVSTPSLPCPPNGAQKSGLLIREMASCRGPSCCFQQCPAHKRCSPTDE